MTAAKRVVLQRGRALLVITLIAIAHGAFFIWYQRPDWQTRWTDQEGYRRLGEVLATTGKFTRYPDAPQFVPAGAAGDSAAFPASATDDDIHL